MKSLTPVGVGASLLKGAGQLATQRVIGWSKSKSYVKGKRNPKVITEQTNVAIQAWEIGALAAGFSLLIGAAGAYEYLTGNPLKTVIKTATTLAENTDIPSSFPWPFLPSTL